MSSSTQTSLYDKATLLCGEVKWQLEDLSYFRKCGEITASPDVQCFGLNCRFCSGICLQFEVFMQHLREQHSKDILDMYAAATPAATSDRQTQTDDYNVDDSSAAVATSILADADVELDFLETTGAVNQTTTTILDNESAHESELDNNNNNNNNNKINNFGLWQEGTTNLSTTTNNNLNNVIDNNDTVFTIRVELLPDTITNDTTTNSMSTIADIHQKNANMLAGLEDDTTADLNSLYAASLSSSTYPIDSPTTLTSPFYANSSASGSPSASCCSSAASTFCFTENTLPEMLMFEEDTVDPFESVGCLGLTGSINNVNYCENASTNVTSIATIPKAISETTTVKAINSSISECGGLQMEEQNQQKGSQQVPNQQVS